MGGQMRTTHDSLVENGDTLNGSNVKEVMNTSAPICISNYVKNNGVIEHSRPTQSRGGTRRQQSGNMNGVRRAQAPYNTQQQTDLGIISGQTMNLARAQTRDGGARTTNQFKMDQTMQNGRFGNARSQTNGSSKQTKYKEEDGFMRGARIAEKIQEFYQTGGQQSTGVIQPNQTISGGFVQIQP